MLCSYYVLHNLVLNCGSVVGLSVAGFLGSRFLAMTSEDIVVAKNLDPVFWDTRGELTREKYQVDELTRALSCPLKGGKSCLDLGQQGVLG